MEMEGRCGSGEGGDGSGGSFGSKAEQAEQPADWHAHTLQAEPVSVTASMAYRYNNSCIIMSTDNSIDVIFQIDRFWLH